MHTNNDTQHSQCFNRCTCKQPWEYVRAHSPETNGHEDKHQRKWKKWGQSLSRTWIFSRWRNRTELLLTGLSVRTWNTGGRNYIKYYGVKTRGHIKKRWEIKLEELHHKSPNPEAMRCSGGFSTMRTSWLYLHAAKLTLARVLIRSKHKVGPDLGPYWKQRDQEGACL